MLTSITCESLVAKNHIFRQIDKLIDLSEIERELSSLYSKICKRGTPLKQSLRMLIVQFMNDYSDRRMEKALQENCPVKWFCGYELQEQTPDHTELFEFAGAAWFSSSEQSKRIIVCFLPFTISDL